MKDTIFNHLTDAISNIKDARNPYDANEITEYQAMQAIDSAITELKTAKLLLKQEMKK